MGKIKFLFILLVLLCLTTWNSNGKFRIKIPGSPLHQITGTEFYNKVVSWKWKERDSLAVQEIIAGNIPSFIKKFVPVCSEIKDDKGVVHHAIFYVSPDYLSIGTNDNWARVPLTPMAAQKIADCFSCFLPTRKMVDLIYQQSMVKLEPIPMFAFRDSSVTMWQHHLMIEGMRKGRSGLIAGIKKDVVISGKNARDPKPNRVAIYGWHLPDGKPIQPLYTGHVNWYVDYSHGIRLIYRKIKVDGKEMDYNDILKHTVYQRLLCDEDWCDFYQYPY